MAAHRLLQKLPVSLPVGRSVVISTYPLGPEKRLFRGLNQRTPRVRRFSLHRPKSPLNTAELDTFRASLVGLRTAALRRDFHTTTASAVFGIYEIADALSQYPAIVAVTGGGGVGVAAGLYRSPAFWKLIAKASADKSVLLLPQKPSHNFQPRKEEVRKLYTMFRSLRKQNGKDVAVAMYITGRPGFGKTQLAREYGKEHHRRNKGLLFKNLFIGTLNAASKSSFLQSYITLALELGCASELKVLENLSGAKGELQSLELLSAAVRKELKKRPGWLLIVDDLSSDVKSVNRAHTGNILHTTEILPAVPTATVPMPTSGISRDIPPNLGVAAAYGISSYKAAWKSFWPQPGDESWGKGYVLVTTHDRRLVERSSPFARELFLNEGMSEADAIALLKKVSGLKGEGAVEGAVEVVNSLDRVPLSVASAGFYMSAERSRNPSYTFREYLEGLEKGIQTESEKMLLSQNLSFPVTMTMAVSMAAGELATDPNLHKVFLLLATCAQSPVPMSLLARILGVRPDLNSAALESIRNCALLFFPQSPTEHDSDKASPVLGDEIETVSLYSGTREIFRELFLGESIPPTDLSTPHMDTQPTLSHLRGGTTMQEERNDLLHRFIDCLVQEYETARYSDSVSSYRLRHLLLPHMEAHLQALGTVSGFHLDSHREMRLCSSLGSGYLLVGRPGRAREVLERALRICETSGGKDSFEAATIAAKLGTTYRYLAMQKESEFVLKEALRIYEHECGEVSTEVADTLNNLSSTYKHMGLYHESRKCLERALEIYDSQYTYYSNHPAKAHILTNLGSTWRSLGDSLKSKELFENALAIQEQLHEPEHPSIALTLGNLSVVYADLGQPQKSVELLQRALEINKLVHGPDHITMAITLSNLSIAHRHLGDVRKSEQLAKEALRKTEAVHGPAHPGVAIALGILGSTYCDLGELTKAQHLLENSVEINKAINGPRHVGTAIAQTQLGRVTRLAGNLKEAREILETALETKELVQGQDHPGTGMTLNSLGKVYHEMGYLTKSLTAFMRSQNIGQKLYSYNPNHPQIAFSEADLAKVVRDCGDIERSARMMQQAIDLYTATVDELSSSGYTTTHPKYASMMAIMGLMLRDLDQLKESRKCLKTALKIQQQILSQQSLMKAETICNLGTVLHRLGERQKALESFDMALSMMKAVKYEHPITATVSAAVARLLLDMGDVHSARLSLDDALKIRTKCCGELHPDVALYHKLIAEISLKTDDATSAKQHLQVASRIYRTLYDREKTMSHECGIELLPILDEWKDIVDDLEQQLKVS